MSEKSDLHARPLAVAVVGANGPDRELIRAVLASLGHDVTMIEAVSAKAASLTRGRLDVVVIDLAAGQDSLKFLRRYAVEADRASVVCLADRRRLDASAEALRLGAIDIVGRPLTRGAIAAALANASEAAQVEAAAPHPDPERDPVMDGVYGASAAMRDLLATARRAAAAHCNVLIVGERGTGREMVGRTIHAGGARHRAPFVKIVCAGVSEPAFGEALDKAADGRTFFLENLGDLPLPQQERLERAVAREPASRFIASALPRLSELVERRLVRRDLVERLSTVRIDTPPLRQRPEDIPLLALHFLKVACERNDVPAKTFSRSALAVLGALPWPGNALELRGLCDRVAVLVPRGVVLLEDLLPHLRFEGAEALGRRRESLRVAREQFERGYITAALLHHKGRMGAAAKELGIERTNLYRKIKRLRIRGPLLE